MDIVITIPDNTVTQVIDLFCLARRYAGENTAEAKLAFVKEQALEYVKHQAKNGAALVAKHQAEQQINSLQF